MATPQQLNEKTKAKKTIEDVLSVIQINRIVFVDDYYDKVSEFIEPILVLCRFLLDDNEQKVTEIIEDIPFDQGEDIWRIALKEKWEVIDGAVKATISAQLIELYEAKTKEKYTEIADDARRDASAISNLKELIPNITGLSKKEWDSKKHDYFKESQDIKTLFLFDEDFTNAGGTTTLGKDYIVEVLRNTDAKSAICGLVSDKFRVDNEIQVYEAFKDYSEDLDQDRVLPVSKDVLRDKPIDFAHRIKLTVVNPSCNALKAKVAEIEKKAHKQAQRDLDNISIYTLEKIVFQASIKEGIWEPDTLFRVHSILQKKEARRLAKKSRKLHRIASEVRNISQIKTSLPLTVDSPNIQTTYPQNWQIQRLELYDDDDYINGYHLPIELGDIFELTVGKKKRFFLIAQPCDLMVRTNGERGQRPVTDVILAEIEDEIPKINNIPISSEHYATLPYFNSENGNYSYVNFQKTVILKLLALDLCVFNADGTSSFSARRNCPKIVIAPWQKRWKIIEAKVQKAITDYKSLVALSANEIPNEILKLAIPQVSESKLFVGSLNPSIKDLSYNLKRIGRFNTVHSSAALLKYSNYMARPAFDMDIGK